MLLSLNFELLVIVEFASRERGLTLFNKLGIGAI